jgi:hypothetical protein
MRRGQQESVVPKQHLALTLFWDQFLCGKVVPRNGIVRFSAERVCRLHQREACRYGIACNNVHLCRELWATQAFSGTPGAATSTPCQAIDAPQPAANDPPGPLEVPSRSESSSFEELIPYSGSLARPWPGHSLLAIECASPFPTPPDTPTTLVPPRPSPNLIRWEVPSGPLPLPPHPAAGVLPLPTLCHSTASGHLPDDIAATPLAPLRTPFPGRPTAVAASSSTLAPVALPPMQPPAPGAMRHTPVTLNFSIGIRRDPASVPQSQPRCIARPSVIIDNQPSPPPNPPRTPRSPRPLPGHQPSEETRQMLERLPQALLQALDEPAEE